MNESVVEVGQNGCLGCCSQQRKFVSRVQTRALLSARPLTAAHDFQVGDLLIVACSATQLIRFYSHSSNQNGLSSFIVQSVFSFVCIYFVLAEQHTSEPQKRFRQVADHNTTEYTRPVVSTDASQQSGDCQRELPVCVMLSRRASIGSLR